MAESKLHFGNLVFTVMGMSRADIMKIGKQENGNTVDAEK